MRRFFNKFHDILSKVASLNKAFPSEEKSYKLIRTIPEHFASIAIISSKLSYEELLKTTATKICRRKFKKFFDGVFHVQKTSVSCGKQQKKVW